MIREALAVGPKGGLPLDVRKNRLEVRRMRYAYDDSDVADEIRKASAAAALKGFGMDASMVATSAAPGAFVTAPGPPTHDSSGQELV